MYEIFFPESRTTKQKPIFENKLKANKWKF